MRYFIKIKYDGSAFYGFQRLNDLPSVQADIERALEVIFQKKVLIKGAGRTDKNVHALAQTAHFDIQTKVNEAKLLYTLNKLTSKYIYIVDCKIVPDNLHARFSVLSKTYVYKINIGQYDPLKENYYWNLKYKVNLELMQECAQSMIGIHDFENFVSGQRDKYYVEIFDIKLECINQTILMTFKAKSFYRYMVRSLVGALVDVGRQKVLKEDVLKALNKDSTQRFSIAPPQGLYLYDIQYEKEY